MVLQNIWRGISGQRTIDPGHRVNSRASIYRQALQYVVADSDMYKRRRSAHVYKKRARVRRSNRRRIVKKRSFASRGLPKRITDTSDWQIPVHNAVTPALARNLLTNIPVGNERVSRDSQVIRLQKFRIRGSLVWASNAESSDTQGVRFMLFAHERGTTPTPAYTANIYGRVDYPEITHVLADFVIRRGSTTEIQRKINKTIWINRKCRYENNTVSTSNLSRDITFCAVGDNHSDGHTFLVDTFRTLTWRE